MSVLTLGYVDVFKSWVNTTLPEYQTFMRFL